MFREALAIAFVAANVVCATTRAEQGATFETDACGVPAADAPVVALWRTITLDAEYGGYWVVAGDVDGDGEIELVSARNFNKNDDHFQVRELHLRRQYAVCAGPDQHRAPAERDRGVEELSYQ